MDADNDTYKMQREKVRKPVKVGDQLRFHSTLHGRDAKGIQVRNYSDRIVEVVSVVEPKPSDDNEPMFNVRAADDVVFAAWEGELNGWYYETGQWVRADGHWAGLERTPSKPAEPALNIVQVIRCLDPGHSACLFSAVLAVDWGVENEFHAREHGWIVAAEGKAILFTQT